MSKEKIDICTSICLSHKINREGDMLIYIVETSDRRYWYLKEFLNGSYECEYSNTLPKNNIKIIVLPLDGVDEFGYIKHTNLKLDSLIKNNKIKKIYTGVVNNYLSRFGKINNIVIISFYDDVIYCKNEFLIKIDVIKTFLEEKLNTRFSDIKTLVIGNDYRSYVLSEKLNLDIYDKGSLASKSLKNVLWSNYDVIINFSSFDLEKCDEKIIIEMNEIQDLDLSILLNCKKIYFINQLMWHYLTKSGGKIMYDSMVNR